MNMPFAQDPEHRERLKGRTVIVGGGGSGIGAAICHELAVNGAQVAVLDVAPDAVHDTARRIRAIGASAHPLVADARVEREAREAVAEAHAHFGRLDAVVACSSPGIASSLEELPPDAWDFRMDESLRGSFRLAKAALPFLKQRGFGNIVCVSCDPAAGVPASAWRANHWGLIGLCDTLRVSLAAHRIQVMVVLTGATRRGAVLHAPAELEVGCIADPLDAAMAVCDALAGPRAPVLARSSVHLTSVRGLHS